MKVRDMMTTLQWGSRLDGSAPAHMLTRAEHGPDSAKTYCGRWVLPWDRSSLLDAVVCRRCLKVLEKYA